MQSHCGGTPSGQLRNEVVRRRLVRLEAHAQLDGERHAEHARHAAHDALHSLGPRRQPGAHAAVADDVDRTSHVDVYKVNLHLRIQQLRRAGLRAGRGRAGGWEEGPMAQRGRPRAVGEIPPSRAHITQSKAMPAMLRPQGAHGHAPFVRCCFPQSGHQRHPQRRGA
eukprot:scaffold17636_cov120-Isochrysis_galbana.AAC.6